MHYIIYQITCKTTSKIYIGKHQTKDVNDGYMGSGKDLGHAKKMYGLGNFTKQILHIFKTEEEMNLMEAELVTEEFCLREDTFNICPGGKGGWGYVNINKLNGTHKAAEKRKELMNDDSWKSNWISVKIQGHQKFKEKYPDRVKQIAKNAANAVIAKYGNINPGILAMNSEEATIKRSLTRKNKKFQQGPNNSQYGKRRIKNETTMEYTTVSQEEFDYWTLRGWVPGKFANGVGTPIKSKELQSRVS